MALLSHGRTQVELERLRRLVHVHGADRMREKLSEGRGRKLLRLFAHLRLEVDEALLAVDIRLQLGGELGGARDLALALLVAQVLERHVRRISTRLGLLQHRRNLQLADEVFELFRAEQHRVHRRRVHQLRVFETVEALGVVLGARVLIRKHLVRLAQLLELEVRVGIVGVLIGVQPARGRAVGRFDLGSGRLGSDAEQLVEGPVFDRAAVALPLLALLALLRKLGVPLRLGGCHLNLLGGQAVVLPRALLLVPGLALHGRGRRKGRLRDAAHDLH